MAAAQLVQMPDEPMCSFGEYGSVLVAQGSNSYWQNSIHRVELAYTYVQLPNSHNEAKISSPELSSQYACESD